MMILKQDRSVANDDMLATKAIQDAIELWTKMCMNETERFKVRNVNATWVHSVDTLTILLRVFIAVTNSYRCDEMVLNFPDRNWNDSSYNIQA
jgi:hypothetical protein